MLQRRDKEIVEHILAHCFRIESKFDSKICRKDDFNLDVYEIIVFNILQIGELAKKLSNEFIANYPTIPWKEIKGMRDRIAHGYDYVEPEQVIIVCRDDMPKLKEFCSNVIDDGNNDIKVVENVDNSKEK